MASEDLSKYQTIVLGIRAYDTQKDVIANNKRLLDFVEEGGRLVVQYNTLGSLACRSILILANTRRIRRRSAGRGFRWKMRR